MKQKKLNLKIYISQQHIIHNCIRHPKCITVVYTKLKPLFSQRNLFSTSAGISMDPDERLRTGEQKSGNKIPARRKDGETDRGERLYGKPCKK